MKVKGGQGHSSQQDQNKQAVAFEWRTFLLEIETVPVISTNLGRKCLLVVSPSILSVKVVESK